MKRIIGYTLAVVLGGGFWTWVAAATASGIVHAWWRHLTDAGPARHMIHAETGPQPSSPADAARINAGAEYPIRISAEWAEDMHENCQHAAERVAEVLHATIDAAHIDHQRAWSEATFGPGPRTQGVVDHIRKELVEILSDPTDLKEWVDVIILAFDGAWRTGVGSQYIIDAIKAKQAKNELREWPDWRTADPDKAIEHVRVSGWSAVEGIGEAP